MYMSPEGVPSKAADVFALGVTLFALLGCDCDESRIPSTALPGGAGVVRDTPALLAELGAGQLGDKVSQLLASMLASDPAARPPAATAETTLRELVEATFTRRADHLAADAAAQAAAAEEVAAEQGRIEVEAMAVARHAEELRRAKVEDRRDLERRQSQLERDRAANTARAQENGRLRSSIGEAV